MRYVWFLLHHFPIPQYFFSSVQENNHGHRDHFAHGGKTMTVSFEEFKGKHNLCA